MELHGWREDLGADDGCTVRFMSNEKAADLNEQLGYVAILSMHIRDVETMPRFPNAVSRQNLACTRLIVSLAASLDYSAACLT